MKGTGKKKCGDDVGHETLRSRGNGRSATERLLLDEGPVTILVVLAVIALWGFELFANIRSGVQGWAAILHLAVVGSLECFIAGYLVRAVVRKARLCSGVSQPGAGCGWL